MGRRMSLAEGTGGKGGWPRTSGEYADGCQQGEKRLGRPLGNPLHLRIFISLVGRINCVLNINEEC